MKNFLILSVVVLTAFAVTTGAYALNIGDNYYGKGFLPDVDVVGPVNEYGIDSIDVLVDEVTGAVSVKINTAFAGFYYSPGYTEPYAPGDLFISVSPGGYNNDPAWTPFGTAPYKGDDMSNGTDWEFAMDFETSQLYDIRNLTQSEYDDVIMDSDEAAVKYGFNNSSYRHGQEVLLDTTSQYLTPSISTGSVKTDKSSFFMFDFVLDTALLQPGYKLAFHWGETCANDVIEGEYDPIPEPSTVLLLGLGLLGVAAVGRKRMKK